MKKSQVYFKKLSLLVLSLLLLSASGSKDRKLELKFHMIDVQSFVPSYQMAIWIENIDGTYIRTLFLSEYLSYGGYNLPEICPEWSKKADWENVSKEEFDAVTGATPRTGEVDLKLICPGNLLPEGKYRLFVEVHLVDEYNELYTSDIEITGKKGTGEFKVSYINGKCPKKLEGDLLTSVTVKFKK